jgi:hypothetical protein
MDSTCGTHRTDGKSKNLNLRENLKGRSHFRDLGLDGRTNVMVEGLTLLLRIRKFPGSNLCPETWYPKCFRGSSQSVQANAGVVPEIRPRALSSTSFPFHHSRITLSLIALMMEAVRTSETSVHFNMPIRRYIPEDSTLHLSTSFFDVLSLL